MKAAIYYSDRNLERAGHLRKEGHTHDLNNQNHVLIPTWREKFFFRKDSNPYFNSFAGSGSSELSGERIFLGILSERYVFGVDLSELELTDVVGLLGDVVVQDLRDVVLTLDKEIAALLAFTKGIAGWNRSHKYCGSCGCLTISQEQGHSRKCGNNTCGQVLFPRIDPAVIALIEYKPEKSPALCLLNRIMKEKGYICSPFAGFVEIGESLEDAVVREMKEEVGLSVSNLRYVTSQPWPFPSSIMIGFMAESSSLKYEVDNVEIKEAKWYSALELNDLVEKGELQLSKSDSIARFLIEAWISENL